MFHGLFYSVAFPILGHHSCQYNIYIPKRKTNWHSFWIYMYKNNSILTNSSFLFYLHPTFYSPHCDEVIPMFILPAIFPLLLLFKILTDFKHNLTYVIQHLHSCDTKGN